jgi:hypothetical protein
MWQHVHTFTCPTKTCWVHARKVCAASVHVATRPHLYLSNEDLLGACAQYNYALLLFIRVDDVLSRQEYAIWPRTSYLASYRIARSQK